MAQFILFESKDDEHLLPEADQSQADDSDISGSDSDISGSDSDKAERNNLIAFDNSDPYDLPRGLPDSILAYLQPDSYLATLVNLADNMPSKKKPTKFQQKIEEQEHAKPDYLMNPSTSEQLDVVIEHQLQRKHAEQQKKRIALDAIAGEKAKKKKLVQIKPCEEDDDEVDEGEEIQSDEELKGKKEYQYYTSYWLLRLKIAFSLQLLKEER